MSTAKPKPVIDEIARLTMEIARVVEQIGPPCAELEASALARLTTAAAHFRAHGFHSYGQSHGEVEHYAKLSFVGALMTVAPEKIAEAERARVRAAFAAAGGRGMTEAERSDQLGALRGKLRRAFARRELEWRQREAAGVDVERGAADAEMFLRSGQDLADIAAGKEPD